MKPRKEREIQDAVMLAAPRHGYRLLRNNVGVARAGRRVIAFGVGGPGGSDLIGWRSVEVTQDMVGSRVAVFSAVECKDLRGRTSAEQENFLRVVREAGGIAIVARSEEDLACDKQSGD